MFYSQFNCRSNNWRCFENMEHRNWIHWCAYRCCNQYTASHSNMCSIVWDTRSIGNWLCSNSKYHCTVDRVVLDCSSHNCWQYCRAHTDLCWKILYLSRHSAQKNSNKLSNMTSTDTLCILALIANINCIYLIKDMIRSLCIEYKLINWRSLCSLALKYCTVDTVN